MAVMQKLKQHKMPTMYDGFDFPPVAYAEYPKWIKSPSDGKEIIVYNSREEKEIMDEAPKDFVTSGKLIPEKDERTFLMEKAEKLGLDIHHATGLARIRTMVKEAEAKFTA